jgi:PAS domain S-box-containing protein
MDVNNNQDAEEFYRIFQNLVDVAIFTMDPQGQIKSWNAGAQRIFGYPPSEILGQPLAKIFTQADKTARQAQWEMDTARKEGRADDERWHVRQNGELFWASGILSAVRDADGNVSGFVKVIMDLTDRKHAEEQRDHYLRDVQEANQAKDRFLATLSHELRTPLAAIVGWISMMREGRLREDQIPPAIDSIYRNALIQKGLIDDLLDISRISVGQLNVEMRSLDLNEVIRRALDSVRFMAAAKDIQVNSVVEEPIGSVSGDARRLQQILWNLLANAVKFTPQGGWINVQAHRKDHTVEIQVRDNGQGMNAEFIPHAFETFRQEKDSTTRPYGGMGLGLAIVKQLTELHGGKVTAFSEGVGKGSTFTLTLPSSHAEAAVPEPEQAATPDQDSLTNKRVLILENDPDCRDFLKTTVEEHGGKAQTAQTSREALAQAKIFRPDLIVVDIVLPEEDGYEFVKKLRASSEAAIRNIPTIALTALVTEDIQKRALEAGFQMFLAKPIPAPELVMHIVSLLEPANSGKFRRTG